MSLLLPFRWRKTMPPPVRFGHLSAWLVQSLRQVLLKQVCPCFFVVLLAAGVMPVTFCRASGATSHRICGSAHPRCHSVR